MCLNDSESIGITALLEMGFAVTGTGGGCTALVKECDDGAEIYVTDGECNAPHAGSHEWWVGEVIDECFTDDEGTAMGSPKAMLAVVRELVDAHSDMACDACRSYGPGAKGCRCGGAK